ncbi:lytic transglycosylase domain-containing protein [Rhizobium leguminosarum]|uniref:lytic transglycosylase domain-containing protein n=1 Tax=Rhizobium leguminosarum TaxID=384 RepID=UPI000FEC38DF|nr:lytic transglycosylase domain-containing protein [Rhizobium leguminosarum]RWX01275.1 lytic transglycosylase domain-containing protein [Rhizobium leguminosarum]
MRAPHRSQHHRSGARRSRAAHRLLLLLLSGLPLAAAPMSPVQAQTVPPAPAEAGAPFAAFLAEASQRFGIPVAWIRALMRVESAYDVRAVSPKGAMGLMQIMPDTWAYLRTRYRLGGDPFDPRENIIAGTAYVRELYDRYGAPGFLAAYNAGPGRYDEYLANGRPLPAETRAYVAQLAPLVGGEASPAVIAVAAADPLAWTRAPLFIGASDRGPGAGPAQAEPQSRDGDSAAPSRNAAANANPTSGLFVFRREAAGPR